VRGYEILDTEPEASFDDLTWLASCVCQTPVALIRLIDADRQWFNRKSAFPLAKPPATLRFAPRRYCSQMFLSYRMRPGTNGLQITLWWFLNLGSRFYAGATLMTDGYALGTLCVVDRVPRELTAVRSAPRSQAQVLAQPQLRPTPSGWNDLWQRVSERRLRKSAHCEISRPLWRTPAL